MKTNKPRNSSPPKKLFFPALHSLQNLDLHYFRNVL